MLGMHGTAFANYAVDDCDFLIALGARFDDRVAGVPAKFAPQREAHRAHRRRRVRDQQGQARAVEPRRPAAGRRSTALRAHGKAAGLRRATGRRGTRTSPSSSARHAMNYDRDSELIQPYYVIEEINRLTRGEAIIATGVGQHQMWAAQYFDFREPRLWLTSGSMGTMGFGLPAAIGAQFAQPRQARHRHRRRRQHPHEPRRARDRHHLRPAGQGRRAEQLRRRHGQAVAEAVLQGPPVGERQVAAQEGLRQGRAGRRLPVRGAARPQGRRAARRARNSSSSRARRSSRSSSIRTRACTRWSARARPTTR